VLRGEGLEKDPAPAPKPLGSGSNTASSGSGSQRFCLGDNLSEKGEKLQNEAVNLSKLR
jgi:hypothetical protein